MSIYNEYTYTPGYYISTLRPSICFYNIFQRFIYFAISFLGALLLFFFSAKPIYCGIYPENRYAIKPGYRWDGVDRSNGFEVKWFDVQSTKKAGEEESYKYSVEDM